MNIDNLMSTAAKKLGMTPEQLKKQLESGELERTLRSGGKNGEFSAAAAVLNDPEAMKKLMNDPNVRKLRNGR